jgi:hypothetical protein
LNEIGDILLKQSKLKVKKPSLSKKGKSKEKLNDDKITEKYVDSLKKNEKTIKLNSDQLVGLGFSLEKNLDMLLNSSSSDSKELQQKKKREPNEYIKFMQTFRKANKGKFKSEAELKEELAKAWKSKKGGCNENPLPLPIEDDDIALDVIDEKTFDMLKSRKKSGNMSKKVTSFSERKKVPHTFDYCSMLDINHSEKKLDVEVEKKTVKKILNDDLNVGLAKFAKYFKNQSYK